VLSQTTATRNRLRGLLTQIYQALNASWARNLKHYGVPDALTRWPTPHALQTAGRGHVGNRIAKNNP